jgi:hypothetical protein
MRERVAFKRRKGKVYPITMYNVERVRTTSTLPNCHPEAAKILSKSKRYSGEGPLVMQTVSLFDARHQITRGPSPNERKLSFYISAASG